MIGGLSPTQRTLRDLRQQGRICAIAEKWNPFGGPINPKTARRVGIRKDLFGWIDIVVLDPERGIGGIQSTGQAFSEHVKKLLDSECTENVIEWLKSGKCCTCGNHLTFVEVWGWRQLVKKRGGKAKVWVPRVREITLDDFGEGSDLGHGGNENE